jgi:hypothetical protein
LSLDIATLDDTGSPYKAISLSLDEHYDLTKNLNDSFHFLQRIGDYYSDAEFESSELHELKSDLERLKEKVSSTEGKIIERILEKVLFAISIGKKLYFIAD